MPCLSPPPALTVARLVKKDIVMRFENGWQRGRVTGATRRDGCNFAVKWESEHHGRFQLATGIGKIHDDQTWGLVYRFTAGVSSPRLSSAASRSWSAM